MTIAENIRLEQEMSIIRDPLDQTKQMAVNADGSISVSPATNSVQVVSGAAAVGSVPTVPPVGVSGVDDSGLKRAVLTDATGKLTTVTPDCLDVSGSVSAAGVLFTVDMLNYQSITVNITSAGSSCTIIWEGSADNSTNWIPVSASNVAPTPASNSFSSTTGVTGGFIIAKRLRYFRARVSVYGSGTVTAVGTLLSGHNTISTLALCVGTSTEGSAVSGIPLTVAVEARSTRKTAVANGQTVRPIATVDGRLIVRSHSIPENEWQYAAASGGITNTTTAATLVAAQAAGVRNYLTSLQISSDVLGAATEIAIRDGAGGTVLWRGKIGTAGIAGVSTIQFSDPLKSTAATLLEVVTLSASVFGGVYVNAQGYYAP